MKLHSFILCFHPLSDKIKLSLSLVRTFHALCANISTEQYRTFLSSVEIQFENLESRPAGWWMFTIQSLSCRKSSIFSIICTESLGLSPVLVLSLWLHLQFPLQSAHQAATPSSRTPTAAPPSAPAGCSSPPCRTSSATTPSLQDGTSFRFLISRRACPPSVWR